MYIICSGLKTGYYLKICDPTVRLISYLLDSNRKSTEDFIKVSKNWLAGELTCPSPPWQNSWYSYFPSTHTIGLIAFVLPSPIPFLHAFHYLLFIYLLICFIYYSVHKIFADFSFVLTLSLVYCVVSKRFKLNLHAVHVKDLNFVLRSKIFVHYDE